MMEQSSTRTQIEARLNMLEDEARKANDLLATLRPQVQQLEVLLLRLSGATQVLQEVLNGRDHEHVEPAPVS
jgi:hypothetical protein